jgi:hypothetical protein
VQKQAIETSVYTFKQGSRGLYKPLTKLFFLFPEAANIGGRLRRVGMFWDARRRSLTCQFPEA